MFNESNLINFNKNTCYRLKTLMKYPFDFLLFSELAEDFTFLWIFIEIFIEFLNQFSIVFVSFLFFLPHFCFSNGFRYVSYLDNYKLRRYGNNNNYQLRIYNTSGFYFNLEWFDSLFFLFFYRLFYPNTALV